MTPSARSGTTVRNCALSRTWAGDLPQGEGKPTTQVGAQVDKPSAALRRLNGLDVVFRAQLVADEVHRTLVGEADRHRFPSNLSSRSAEVCVGAVLD